MRLLLAGCFFASGLAKILHSASLTSVVEDAVPVLTPGPVVVAFGALELLVAMALMVRWANAFVRGAVVLELVVSMAVLVTERHVVFEDGFGFALTAPGAQLVADLFLLIATLVFLSWPPSMSRGTVDKPSIGCPST